MTTLKALIIAAIILQMVGIAVLTLLYVGNPASRVVILTADTVLTGFAFFGIGWAR